MRRKIRNLLIELAVALVVLLFLTTQMISFFLSSQSAQNIPDPVFRQMIEQWVGVAPGEPIPKNRLENYTGVLKCFYTSDPKLNPGKHKIRDLTGIGYFKNITGLNCHGQDLTHLDLSKNPALTVLECDGNALTALDLSANTALEQVNCNYNQIQKLVLPESANLKYLYCQSNRLTHLDVSRNPNLLDLNCGMNQIYQIDLSANPSLRHLDCRYNRLTYLDVSRNLKLEHLDFSHNFLRHMPDLILHVHLQALGAEFNYLPPEDLPLIHRLEERFTGVFRYNSGKVYDGIFYQEQRGYNLADYESE
ncbi:MAG TPA: hypothetical protein PLX83_16460 [bacterium]|nr:hypothetical protein [bacterium]